MADDRDSRRAAVGSLGDALRELVDAAVLTEVPLEELAAATTAARELAARLRSETRPLTSVAVVDDPDVGERWYNPVYGPGNPLAAPLHVDVPARRRWNGPVQGGRPELARGGEDGVLRLARSARSAGHGGLTSSLSVRFRRPVPLGVPLVLEAEVESVDGRRATARGRLVAEDAPGTTLAEGEALLVALRADRAAEVFAPTGRSVDAWTARS